MDPGGAQWGWDPHFQLWVQLLLWGLLLGRLLRYRGAWGGQEREHPPGNRPGDPKRGGAGGPPRSQP